MQYQIVIRHTLFVGKNFHKFVLPFSLFFFIFLQISFFLFAFFEKSRLSNPHQVFGISSRKKEIEKWNLGLMSTPIADPDIAILPNRLVKIT